MVAENLSQEDIEALLKGAGADSGGGNDEAESAGPAEAIPPESEKILREFADIFTNSYSEVLYTLLGKEIEINVSDISKNTMSLMQDTVGEQGLASKLFLGKNIDYLALNSTDFAAVTADLMMMGDGQVEFSPEEHPDAINEMLNQIQGVISSKLTNIAGKSISFDPTDSSLEDVFNIDVLHYQYSITFIVQIGDEFTGHILVLTSKDFTDKISALMNPQSSKPSSQAQPSGSTTQTHAAADRGSGPFTNDDTEISPAVLPSFDASSQPTHLPRNIDLLMDVSLDLNVELGRTKKTVKSILELGPGSIIQLTKLAGEPVDVMINDQLIAQGEVVVVDEAFGVRITNLVSPEERIKKLGGKY